MLIKSLAVVALCLVPLCLSDRLRILSSPEADQQTEHATQKHALKSRIRSLTLKSTIERALANSKDDVTTKAKIAVSKASFATKTTSLFSVDRDVFETTTAIYNEAPTSTTQSPVTQSTLTPSWPQGCFCLKPCSECGCTSTPAPSPAPPYPTKQPCQNGTTPQPGCCIIPVAIPCYSCPCLSQCSIVPVPDCPCNVDPYTEYKCPFHQPHGVTLDELPDKINNGFRLLENLRETPNCVYNNGSPDGIYTQGSSQYQQQQLPWPVGGSSHQQINPLHGSFKAADSALSQEHQPSQFVPLGAGAAGEFSQAQQSNYYLYRQQRQRALPNQGYNIGGYPQQRYLQSLQYPVPSQYQIPSGHQHPIPSQYVTPSRGDSYPVGPQYATPPRGDSYPIYPPVPYAQPSQYPFPTSTTENPTTSHESSSVDLTISSLALAASLLVLLSAFDFC